MRVNGWRDPDSSADPVEHSFGVWHAATPTFSQRLSKILGVVDQKLTIEWY